MENLGLVDSTESIPDDKILRKEFLSEIGKHEDKRDYIRSIISDMKMDDIREVLKSINQSFNGTREALLDRIEFMWDKRKDLRHDLWSHQKVPKKLDSLRALAPLPFVDSSKKQGLLNYLRIQGSKPLSDMDLKHFLEDYARLIDFELDRERNVIYAGFKYDEDALSAHETLNQLCFPPESDCKLTVYLMSDVDVKDDKVGKYQIASPKLSSPELQETPIAQNVEEAPKGSETALVAVEPTLQKPPLTSKSQVGQQTKPKEKTIQDPFDSLHIRNFVGSVVDTKVYEFLADFGEIDFFWMTRLKYEAFVCFHTSQDAKRAYEFVNGLQYPEETGKKLISTLLKRSVCLEKQKETSDMEDKMGGPKIPYSQVAPKIERQKKSKFDGKKMLETKVRHELASPTKSDQEMMVSKSSMAIKMEVDDSSLKKRFELSEIQEPLSPRKRPRQDVSEEMDSSSLTHIRPHPTDTILVKGFKKDMNPDILVKLFCRHGLFEDLRVDSTRSAYLLKVAQLMIQECALLSLEATPMDYEIHKEFFDQINKNESPRVSNATLNSNMNVACHPFNRPRKLTDKALDELIPVLFFAFLISSIQSHQFHFVHISELKLKRLIRVHELREWVEAFGSCEIKFDWKSQMIVHYSSQTVAENAAKNLEGQVVNGQRIKVLILSTEQVDSKLRLDKDFDDI